MYGNRVKSELSFYSIFKFKGLKYMRSYKILEIKREKIYFGGLERALL